MSNEKKLQIKNDLQIIIKEPENCLDFYPFSVMHCIWEIRCGALRNIDKIRAIFPQQNIAFQGREKHIASFLQRENSTFTNKIAKNIPSLIIFANVIFDLNFAKQIFDFINNSENQNLIFVDDSGKKIGFYINFDFENFAENDLNNFTIVSLPTVKQINYLWEALDFQAEQINSDVKLMQNVSSVQNATIFANAIFINAKNIFLGKNVVIEANTILDATNGAIVIDDNAKIMYNSVIIGSCYIGKNSIVKIGAKIYENCSFGESCKIGGELECSTFHSFANKQHDGFIGHSYICEWVNLGAGTNNSDLKNNYSKITIQLPHKAVKTARQFLGLMCGDHSKSAINSAFSSGTILGVSSMFANSGLSPKFIPSLKWCHSGDISDYEMDKAIETAKIVMERRNKKLSNEEIELLRSGQ